MDYDYDNKKVTKIERCKICHRKALFTLMQWIGAAGSSSWKCSNCNALKDTIPLMVEFKEEIVGVYNNE